MVKCALGRRAGNWTRSCSIVKAETALSTIVDRRAIVERVRGKNENDYRGGARRAVQKLLSASLPHPWTYVYELTQNALDACAQRISWRIDGESVLFQHDGRIALDESHVHGIASLGASTKGLAHVGFMGVGFKSVFARFRTVSVSGFGFRFKFDVGVNHGNLRQQITQWFDTLLPHWDDDVPNPEAGYTTSILLEHPVVSARTVAEDVERISSPEDHTPLAVLALRGLKHICFDDIEWGSTSLRMSSWCVVTTSKVRLFGGGSRSFHVTDLMMTLCVDSWKCARRHMSK